MLSNLQFQSCQKSHQSSEKYGINKFSKEAEISPVQSGDKVFVKSERSKSKARDPYLVVSVNLDEKTAVIQKFLPKNMKENLQRVKLDNIYKASPKETNVTSVPLDSRASEENKKSNLLNLPVFIVSEGNSIPPITLLKLVQD